MADGPVYTRIEWEEEDADPTEKTLVKAYCNVDGTTWDDLLERLFNAAKRKADAFLCNPFKELNSQITFSGVEANDWIEVNGLMYTAAASGDEDELEFAVGDTDSDTADNFVALVNSTTLGGSYDEVGVAGVTAANSEGVVTLTREFGNVDDIVVRSSDEDKLLVRQVWTNADIPEEVRTWLYQYIFRQFRNPGALLQESVAGKGHQMWVGMKSEESGMGVNFDLLIPYKKVVGL